MAIGLMCATAFIFALQDGFSRVLGQAYPPVLVVMFRYWVFAKANRWSCSRYS